MNHALGQVIRELRLEKQFSLRQLSKSSNISLGYLSEIERGQKEPSAKFLECIAEALGVETGQIVVEVGYRMLGIEHFESLVEQLEMKEEEVLR